MWAGISGKEVGRERKNEAKKPEYQILSEDDCLIFKNRKCDPMSRKNRW